MENKIDGHCEICHESIALCALTLWKDGRYLCALCQIDLNRGMEFKKVLRKRRLEIMEQLYEIDKELGTKERIEVA